MPDICFHFSSETADAAGYCPGNDRTRITMPIEPAIQVPNTAKPTCYLHNLAFSNNIANVYASDQSNKIVLQTGSSALKFHAGSTYKPWIGIKYQVKVNGTLEDFAIVAPMTDSTDTGFEGPTYDVSGNWQWGNILTQPPNTLNGLTVAQIYEQINQVFELVLAGTGGRWHRLWRLPLQTSDKRHKRPRSVGLVSAIATSQALYATLQGQQGQRGAGTP